MCKLKNYLSLEVKEGVCGGRPVIKGTRIEPKHIVNYGTVQEILEDFPYLTKQQVEEAIDYHKNNT